MTSRKPSIGFWITVVLVAVLVGYPLSFGPACWLVDRGMLPGLETARTYRPFVRIANSDVEVMSNPLRWYANLGENGKSRTGPILGPLQTVVSRMQFWLDLEARAELQRK